MQLDNETAFRGYARTATIIVLVAISLVLGGIYLGGWIGALMQVIGAIQAFFGFSALRTWRWRKNGKIMRERDGGKFQLLKAEYEAHSPRVWDDPGRVYLYSVWKARLVQMGKSESEAVVEAANNVEALHPRYYGTF